MERTSITLIVDKGGDRLRRCHRHDEPLLREHRRRDHDAAGEDSPLALRRALAHSRMLSSDVSAGFDPGYAGKFETKNAAFMGRGLCFNKYTGSRGKGWLQRRRPEVVAPSSATSWTRPAWTSRPASSVASTRWRRRHHRLIMAKYGMNVIDSGVAVLSMHALWEVANKADIYEAYRGYKAFLEHA